MGEYFRVRIMGYSTLYPVGFGLCTQCLGSTDLFESSCGALMGKRQLRKAGFWD